MFGKKEEPSDIRFLGDLHRLVLKDGDRFVLTCEHFLSMEQKEHIVRAWKAFIGGDADEFKLLIIDGGLKLGAISTEGLNR